LANEKRRQPPLSLYKNPLAGHPSTFGPHLSSLHSLTLFPCPPPRAAAPPSSMAGHGHGNPPRWSSPPSSSSSSPWEHLSHSLLP
jgi:hypothetical protein